jgi:membrane-associated protein
MSFADVTSPAELLGLLAHHRDIAYLVIFLGAFCETLIPLSFFVYGEVFFLAGAIMAGAGTLDWWAVTAILYSGGILGDNASYWLGRLFGTRLFLMLAGWPLLGRLVRHDRYEQGVAFFRRRGPLAVFFARLAGPLSWTVPCLAGAFRLSYPTFLLYNTLGVIVGIGQFLVVGYVVGNNLEKITDALSHIGALPVILAALGVLALLSRRFRSA